MSDLQAPVASQPRAFRLPPQPHKAGGAMRRVGVEIEFTGLDARAAARALAQGLGGRVAESDPHAFRVHGTALGELAVELDIRYAHPQAENVPFRPGPRLAAWLGRALSAVVPRELVTAPLPLARLALVDEAVAILRRAGARGEGTTWLGSLGLHFNVEPVSLDPADLLPILRAFLLLEPWLRQETARRARWPRFLPPPFPRAYARRVLADGYRPDLAGLVADYLEANPTRDRALDLLPALLELDPAAVRRRLPYEKIKARPVLHYRLPRAHVATPGWSLAADWSRWVEVERLAADASRLAALARAAA